MWRRNGMMWNSKWVLCKEGNVLSDKADLCSHWEAHGCNARREGLNGRCKAMSTKQTSDCRLLLRAKCRYMHLKCRVYTMWIKKSVENGGGQEKRWMWSKPELDDPLERDCELKLHCHRWSGFVQDDFHSFLIGNKNNITLLKINLPAYLDMISSWDTSKPCVCSASLCRCQSSGTDLVQSNQLSAWGSWGKAFLSKHWWF